eukprot:m.19318 g.19318  ORF g.19318 m.19318 type:complete len:442 (-) comp3679_c0_seq1:54-1379(-)
MHVQLVAQLHSIMSSWHAVTLLVVTLLCGANVPIVASRSVHDRQARESNDPTSKSDDVDWTFNRGLEHTCSKGHMCVVRPPFVPDDKALPSHIACGHGLSDPAVLPRVDTIPTNCSQCSCVPGTPPTRLCIFPTVPRSGNTWMRRMLESASGAPTRTVFKAEHLKHHDDSSIVEDDHAQVVYEPRTGLYIPPCGVSNECDKVTVHNASVVIAKSHSPFLMTSGREEYVPRETGVTWPEGTTADIGIGSSVVMAVRNPLDNYYAWHRYLKDKHREEHTGTFTDYLARWRRHMRHWKQNARQHNIPTLVYRYEDLFDDNCRVSVVRGALQLSGLYDELQLTEGNVQSARAFVPTRELESALVRYRTEEKTAYEATEEEVQAALNEPLVEEFGYAGLFRAWLEMGQQQPQNSTSDSSGSENDDHIRAGILGPITKQGMRCFLYW